MLCQFTVKNFQCIKETLTLDMQAANITDNQQTIIEDIDGEEFLPLGVIYGPNGSGKSTVLLALYKLAVKVMRPICAVSCKRREECLRVSASDSIEPFKFSKETENAPTEYELFFRTDTNEYQYRISMLKNKIVDEALYKKALKGKKYATVFERKSINHISLKGALKNYNIEDISDDLPLLSYLGITRRGNHMIRDVIEWFDDRIHFLNYGDPEQDAHVAIDDSDLLKPLILQMLKEMDIDISDYRVEKKDKNIKIFTSHVVDGDEYELNLVKDESNGTIKVFGILPYIAESIMFGRTLIIDELDAKLHPLLLNYIIGLFNDPNINKKKSQLIFTSHDLTTMNSETFRRDEIWFIAKGTNGAAKMYSLIEFKNDDGKTERKDARYDKRYLEGRYGADPYFRRIIDWGEYNE